MRELIQNIDSNLWSRVSALVFTAYFIALTLWVYLPKRKISYEKAAELPLDSD